MNKSPLGKSRLGDMTARDQYLEGLDLGWSNERDGILDPAASAGRPGSPLTDGVRRGRAAWRREEAGALVVDRPPLPTSDQM